jgi:hypothetical protein
MTHMERVVDLVPRLVLLMGSLTTLYQHYSFQCHGRTDDDDDGDSNISMLKSVRCVY